MRGHLYLLDTLMRGRLYLLDTLMRGRLYLLDTLMIINTLDDVMNSVHEPAPLALVL